MHNARSAWHKTVMLVTLNETGWWRLAMCNVWLSASIHMHVITAQLQWTLSRVGPHCLIISLKMCICWLCKVSFNVRTCSTCNTYLLSAVHRVFRGMRTQHRLRWLETRSCSVFCCIISSHCFYFHLHKNPLSFHSGPAFGWGERGPCPRRWLRGGAKKAVTDRPHVNT
jgi:hypothetical protein